MLFIIKSTIDRDSNHPYFFCQRIVDPVILELLPGEVVKYLPFKRKKTVSKKIHQFLTISGSILLVLGVIRLYRVIRMHETDPLFAPHLLGASLSAWISYSLLKIGRNKKVLDRKGAISLIRSGSVLLAIWGYRFYLFLKNPSETGTPMQAYLAPFYVVFGTIVMCVGLKISRGIRKQMRESAALLSEEIAKKETAH